MKNIVIVGVGALGSHVAMLLRNEALLRVIDFDRVESKNTMSQFHSKPSVGKNKTEALKSTMNFLWATKIETIPHKLSEDNVEVLDGAALVIDCLDNGAARRIVQQWCNSRDYVAKQWVEALREPMPLLHGALAPGGNFGRAIWDKDFVIDDEASEGAPTCEAGEFLPFISVTASYIALAAQAFLQTGKQIGYQIHPANAVRI